jgi:hypothetical protein
MSNEILILTFLDSEIHAKYTIVPNVQTYLQFIPEPSDKYVSLLINY